jgi:hypothetical protein
MPRISESALGTLCFFHGSDLSSRPGNDCHYLENKLAYEMLIPSELGEETFTQQEILSEVTSILYELARAAEEHGLSVAPYFQRLSALGLGLRDAAGSSGRQRVDN